MPAAVGSIEIARHAEEVFAYVMDLQRLPEWQDNVVRACVDGGGMPEVGSRCTLTRQIAGAEREITSEVTALIPPTRWAIRGVEGPIRAVVNGRVEALDANRCRVTIELDLEGHGVGRALVPLVARRQVRKALPIDLRNLKARLERTGP